MICTPPPAIEASAPDVLTVISCMAVKLGELLSDSPKRIVVAADRPPMVWRCSAGLPPWIERSVKVSPAVPPTSCELSALVLATPTPPPAPRMMPGCKRGEVDAEPAGRHGVDDFLGNDSLYAGAANVHERRLAGDGDGFRDLADLHVGVDRDDGGAADLHRVTLEGVEPLQREGDGVGAGHELDDLVLARAVRDGRPRLSR